MQVLLDPKSVEGYRLFLRIKSLPRYRIVGRMAEFPDEYADLLGLKTKKVRDQVYKPIKGLFDYQFDVTGLALRKKKFAIFAACGLGKTLMFTEYARHVSAVLPEGQCVLIVSPLMVIRQTLDEARRFYGERLPIEQVSAKNLDGWLRLNDSRVGITNYDAVTANLRRGRLGCLILDECFPAGTMVDCVENGSSTKKPIQNIVPGDMITNAAGVDQVVATKRREVTSAVKIRAGSDIIASRNHPFFTSRGWKFAEELEPGDSIILAREAVRVVRGDFQTKRHSRSWEILRQVLLSEMAHEPAGVSSQSPHGCCSQEEGTEEERVVCCGIGCRREGEAENFLFEPYDRSSCQGEGVSDFEREETQAKLSGREREGIDKAAGVAVAPVGGGVETGTCRIFGTANSGLSDVLQAGPGKCGTNDWYRAGRQLPPFKKRTRQKEGREACFVRVESVEILERGHPELEQLRDANGKLYFYDLQAARHPSFSVGGLLVHNSSMLKSHYGKWGTKLIELGRGLDYKLCLTGTPAPNDRIEYANHAVFLDAFPTVNSFLARFFVNRGQTGERWEIKPHALRAFYLALSHWCIFLENPATYGWKDNTNNIPPIRVHIHDVELTEEQQDLVYARGMDLFASNIGGITNRTAIAQIAKGHHRGERIKTRKFDYIKKLVDSWPDESTIIWCLHNNEQDDLEQQFPEAASIRGNTPYTEREKLVADFKAGRRRVLISKPKVLGLGLNLQVATRQVFSGLQDSFESFHQAVKRSNRIGSTRPLNVHIPISEIERPMVETVLKKAKRVQADTEEQERLFREVGACRI